MRFRFGARTLQRSLCCDAHVSQYFLFPDDPLIFAYGGVGFIGMRKEVASIRIEAPIFSV